MELLLNESIVKYFKLISSYTYVAMLASILKQVGIFTCTVTFNNSLWDASNSTINITVNFAILALSFTFDFNNEAGI